MGKYLLLFFIIFVFIRPGLLYASNNADKYNLYVIIEMDLDNKGLNARSLALLGYILKEAANKKLNINSIYVRNAADKLFFSPDNMFNEEKIRLLRSSKDMFIYNHLERIRTIRSNMVSAPVYLADILSQLSGDLENFGWRADKSILLYLGDLIYSDNRISSRGGYLSLGFLNNENSSLFKKVINKNNESLNDLKVVVIGKQVSSPKIYFNQREFIATLFYKMNPKINLLYYSPGYNNFFGGNLTSGIDIVNRFAIDIIKFAIDGKLSKITPSKKSISDKSNLTSIHYEDGEINNFIPK